MGSNSLVGSLINAVKEHSRAFGVAGAVIGAILVIYYCSSINFYPSGLNLADALFFLWVVVVFGFYYSLIAFAFFIASIFWVTVFAKPLNFVLKLKNRNNDISVPLPKSDFFMVLVSGFIANILILGVGYFIGHSIAAIFLALFLIGFIYSAIDNLSRDGISGSGLLKYNGEPINRMPIRQSIVKNVFYVLIYICPLLFGQVGGGVTRATFETMGVRQEDVTLHIQVEDYKNILEIYESEGFISSLVCNEVCTIKKANILFTNIGINTKIKLSGSAGDLQFVLPTTAIKLIAKLNIKNSIQPTADAMVN